MKLKTRYCTVKQNIRKLGSTINVCQIDQIYLAIQKAVRLPISKRLLHCLFEIATTSDDRQQVLTYRP